MPLQTDLSAIAILRNEAKGNAALAFSRDLGTSYKTAFVLAHGIREAMASEMKGVHFGEATRYLDRFFLRSNQQQHQEFPYWPNWRAFTGIERSAPAAA
jgi:hypothetical protein